MPQGDIRVQPVTDHRQLSHLQVHLQRGTAHARAGTATEFPVQIGPARFANPYFAASGCFGYGLEYARFIAPTELGAIVTKTITLEPRGGNPPPRRIEHILAQLRDRQIAFEKLETFEKQILNDVWFTKFITPLEKALSDRYAGLQVRLVFDYSAKPSPIACA